MWLLQMCELKDGQIQGENIVARFRSDFPVSWAGRNQLYGCCSEPDGGCLSWFDSVPWSMTMPTVL